jgi:hypothetical protein
LLRCLSEIFRNLLLRRAQLSRLYPLPGKTFAQSEGRIIIGYAETERNWGSRANGLTQKNSVPKLGNIIADNLSKAGWSLGWVSAIDFSGPNNLDC